VAVYSSALNVLHRVAMCSSALEVVHCGAVCNSALTVVYRVACDDGLCGLVSQFWWAVWPCESVFGGLCGLASRCSMGCVVL